MVIVDTTVVGGRERAVKGVRYVRGRRMCAWERGRRREGGVREEEGREE